MARLRLRRQLVVGAVAALGLVAALEVGADRSVLSRGSLLPGHHDTTCGQCHEAFGGRVRDAACLRCHEDLPTGPARAFRKTLCVTCHWDHRGNRPIPDEEMREICLSCHGTAEITEDGTRTGRLLDFHPPHRPGSPRP